MSTFHNQSSIHRNPNIKSGLLDALRRRWRRWRTRLARASTLFTGPLALLAFIACDGPGGGATAAASTCPGSISLAWSITTSLGRPLTCAQASATHVALRFQSRTGGTPVFTAFPCASNLGTADVAPGLYDVAIELHDASGARLATSPPQTSVAVAVGRTKVLAPVTFALGTGGGGNNGVALTLEAANVVSNCQPTSGGAGITGTAITIIRSDGGCAPVTLVRSRGGVEIGDYKVNCSSPEIVGCIERDETLTTTGLAPAARFNVHVVGKMGPADCWIGDSQLDVPATGQLEIRVVLRRQIAPGC